jgi:hydroxyacylglutathione hydrolase
MASTHSTQYSSLTATQLSDRYSDLLVLDVRSSVEYLLGHIPGAEQFDQQIALQTVPKHQPIVVVCLSGRRSVPVAQWLVKQGYQTVYNLSGGVLAWQQAGYPIIRGS